MKQDIMNVNLYLIDQETHRKILFRVNPLMLGKPENTTIMFPNGVEYKLVATAKSDVFQIADFFDQHECIMEEAAKTFPEFGLPGKPAPSKDEEIQAMLKAIDNFINQNDPNDNDDNVYQAFRDFYADKTFETMIHEVSTQKLEEWISTHRTLDAIKKDMETRQQDTRFLQDYLKRFTTIIQTAVTAMEDHSTTVTFDSFIRNLTTNLNDLQKDLRQDVGKDWIMEFIRFYEPVQGMFSPVIQTIMKKHSEGYDIKLNELYSGDQMQKEASITQDFWNQFKIAVTSCQDALKEKEDTLQKFQEEHKAFTDVKAFNKDVIRELKDTFKSFNTAYDDFNGKMKSLVTTEEHNQDEQQLVQEMFEQHLLVLLKSLDITGIRVSTYYDEDENKISEQKINELFFMICKGLALSMQQGANPVENIVVAHDLVKQFQKQLDEAEKLEI